MVALIRNEMCRASECGRELDGETWRSQNFEGNLWGKKPYAKRVTRHVMEIGVGHHLCYVIVCSTVFPRRWESYDSSSLRTPRTCLGLLH